MVCGGKREEQIQSLTQQDCRHVDRTSDLLVTVVIVC